MEMPSVWCAAALASLALGLSATSHTGTGEATPTQEVTVTSVTHINVKSSKPFDAVTAAIEKQLGKFDAEKYGSMMQAPTDPAQIESTIHAMEGSSGFMLFTVRDHGRLLSLKGKKAFDRQTKSGIRFLPWK